MFLKFLVTQNKKNQRLDQSIQFLLSAVQNINLEW